MAKISQYPDGGSLQSSDQIVVARSGQNYSILGSAVGGGGSDGWTEVTETWTRTGTHSFTVSGDLRTKYQKGTKVKYNDGAVEYGVVGAVSYSAPNTTVTLISNSDYSMANVAITGTYISYQENPQGFPQVFNYSVTFPNTSGGMTYTSVTITTAYWMPIGKSIRVVIFASGTTGGSIDDEINFSLPIDSNSTANCIACAAARDATSGIPSVASAAITTTYGIVRKGDVSNFALGTGRVARWDGTYQY